MHFVWQYSGFMQRRAETYNADRFSKFWFLNLECRQKPRKTSEKNMKTKKAPKKQRKPMNKNTDNQNTTNEQLF